MDADTVAIIIASVWFGFGIIGYISVIVEAVMRLIKKLRRNKQMMDQDRR